MEKDPLKENKPAPYYTFVGILLQNEIGNKSFLNNFIENYRMDLIESAIFLYADWREVIKTYTDQMIVDTINKSRFSIGFHYIGLTYDDAD